MARKRRQTGWLDIDTIRENASVEEILRRHGLWEGRMQTGNQLRVIPPGSEKQRPSLSIHLEKGVWQDFAKAHVDSEGKEIPKNIFGLEMMLSGVGFRRALEILAASSREEVGGALEGNGREEGQEGLGFYEARGKGGVVEGEAKEGESLMKEEGENSIFGKVLAVRTRGLPRFEKLGIKESTLKAFGVGFYNGPGLLRHYIVYPVRDRLSRVVFYFGEAVRESQNPQTKFPPGVRRSWELFNIDRVIHDEMSRKETERHGLVVVEHPDLVMKLTQEGRPNVVAIMDHRVSERQAELLVDKEVNPNQKVCLVTSDSEKGRLGRKESARRLIHRGYVRYM